MDLDDGRYPTQPSLPEEPPFDEGEPLAPSISPARRAALEALEREFRDLLAPQS